MKYILPEYTLNEKFILNEADTDETETSAFTTPKEFKDYWTNHRGNVDDDFWNNYFNLIFKGNKELIVALAEIKATFLKEVFALGFDKTYNPFITYINKIWNILGKQLPKQEIYNTIHNAAANQKLNKLDIAEDPKSVLGENNIIFNPKYVKEIQDYNVLKYYLDKQFDIMTKNNAALTDEIKKILKDKFKIKIKPSETKLTKEIIKAIFESMPERDNLEELAAALGVEAKEDLDKIVDNVILAMSTKIPDNIKQKQDTINYFLADLISFGNSDPKAREKVFDNAVQRLQKNKPADKIKWPAAFEKNRNVNGHPSKIAWDSVEEIDNKYHINGTNYNKPLDKAINLLPKYFKFEDNDKAATA